MDIIESILVLSKAGFSAGDIKAMLSLRSQTPAQQMPTQAQQMQTPAQPVQPVQQMPTPAQQMPTPPQPVQPVQQMPTPAQPVQPVQQMPTPAQPVQQTGGLDSQLIGNLMNSITGLQNAIQAQAIFYTQQPHMVSGAQMADDALASIVLPSNNS